MEIVYISHILNYCHIKPFNKLFVIQFHTQNMFWLFSLKLGV